MSNRVVCSVFHPYSVLKYRLTWQQPMTVHTFAFCVFIGYQDFLLTRPCSKPVKHDLLSHWALRGDRVFTFIGKNKLTWYSPKSRESNFFASSLSLFKIKQIAGTESAFCWTPVALYRPLRQLQRLAGPQALISYAGKSRRERESRSIIIKLPHSQTAGPEGDYRTITVAVEYKEGLDRTWVHPENTLYRNVP